MDIIVDRLVRFLKTNSKSKSNIIFISIARDTNNHICALFTEPLSPQYAKAAKAHP